MISRYLFVALAVIGAFAIGFVCYVGLRTPDVGVRAAQSVQPFTMQQEVYAYALDPAGTLTTRRTVARQRNGTEAVVDVVRTGQTDNFQVLRKVEYADGRARTFLDALKATMSGHVDPSRLERRMAAMTNPPANCVAQPNEKVAGEETLHGQRFLIVEAADSRARRRSWKSPQMGCIPVQVVQEESVNGGELKRTLHVVLISLSQTDPSEQLFVAGDGFKEMTPTESYYAAAKARGIDPEKCGPCKESVWELEKAYWTRQAPPPLQ